MVKKPEILAFMAKNSEGRGGVIKTNKQPCSTTPPPLGVHLSSDNKQYICVSKVLSPCRKLPKEAEIEERLWI